MATDSNASIQPDDWKINMSDAWQVLWWCRYLGLTKTQLERAIEVAGPVIVDLKQYLASHPGHKTDSPVVQPPVSAGRLSGRNTITRSPF